MTSENTSKTGPGWNDPPPSIFSVQQNGKAAPRPTKLNQRVAFPISSSTTLSSTSNTVNGTSAPPNIPYNSNNNNNNINSSDSSFKPTPPPISSSMGTSSQNFIPGENK